MSTSLELIEEMLTADVTLSQDPDHRIDLPFHPNSIDRDTAGLTAGCAFNCFEEQEDCGPEEVEAAIQAVEEAEAVQAVQASIQFTAEHGLHIPLEPNRIRRGSDGLAIEIVDKM